MRPLSQPTIDRYFRCSSGVLRRRLAHATIFAFVVSAARGCSQSAATGGAAPPPPPPSIIEVSVTPQSENVTLGNSQSFVATVTNTNNTSVSWSVNGVAGGNSVFAVIDSAGMYTAPADLPSPTTVRVTATSAADPTRTATANLTVVSDTSIQLSPNVAGVELGALQAFTSVISSAAHPDSAVRWSLSGASCPSGCGSVDAGGNFTAPQILPAPASVTISAQSVADPTKHASASISIGSHFTFTISAPASVPTGASAAIVATLTAVLGSNPSTAVSWTLSGTGCSGSGCGTLTTVTTQFTGSGKTASDSATYVAPAAATTPDTVTITVTPQADPSKLAQATLAIAPGVGVAITPGTAPLAANHRTTLTPQVNGAANSNVLWNVNGVPGGSAALGLICAAGSNPCQQVLSPSAAAIDYLAPGAIPSPDPVAVQAVSAVDATKNATAQITVINHALVSVFPGSATLPPLGAQSFSASVLGSTDQGVTWQISGIACGPGSGFACGSIDANGTYTAPPTAPSPDAVQIVAVRQDDTAQSGSSSVTISTGVNISAPHPAGVYAGGLQGFTLRVDGSGLVLPGATAGSTIWIASTPRTTTCVSGAECFAPVSAADVSLTGTDSVQIRNPDGTQSNAVNLVVAAPNISNGIVSLSAAAPAVSDEDIVVVEPTTAGVSSPNDDVDLDVAALGAFSTANSCTLAGNPVSLVRPASGSITADVCLFSQSGLDASMTVIVSGPSDVTVISKQPAGLGILHITLLIPATASAGARTLFIQTTNLDKTAATGSAQLQ
jgi:hypothetical protein